MSDAEFNDLVKPLDVFLRRADGTTKSIPAASMAQVRRAVASMANVTFASVWRGSDIVATFSDGEWTK